MGPGAPRAGGAGLQGGAEDRGGPSQSGPATRAATWLLPPPPLPPFSLLPPAGVLEKPLEKKSGRNYGPPGTKKLIYFIDDMNMPEVDKYGTVAPHTLIRQHMDHKHW